MTLKQTFKFATFAILLLFSGGCSQSTTESTRPEKIVFDVDPIHYPRMVVVEIVDVHYEGNLRRYTWFGYDDNTEIKEVRGFVTWENASIREGETYQYLVSEKQAAIKLYDQLYPSKP